MISCYSETLGPYLKGYYVNMSLFVLFFKSVPLRHTYKVVS